MAAESDKASKEGPVEGYYYQLSSFTPLEAGPDGLDVEELLAGAKVEGKYPNHLDWFTLDLEGEHSAMDGWILEQHANYVVVAVHRVFNSSLLLGNQFNFTSQVWIFCRRRGELIVLLS